MKAVFVDTSFWKALVDPQDDFCPRAMAFWEKAVENNIRLVTSNFVLDETFTLLRYKGGKHLALELRQLLADNQDCIEIARVLAHDEAMAWTWFKEDWSKLSFTDCVSFAQMRRLGIQESASFDSHFERAGYTLCL